MFEGNAPTCNKLVEMTQKEAEAGNKMAISMLPMMQLKSAYLAWLADPSESNFAAVEKFTGEDQSALTRAVAMPYLAPMAYAMQDYQSASDYATRTTQQANNVVDKISATLIKYYADERLGHDDLEPLATMLDEANAKGGQGLPYYVDYFHALRNAREGADFISLRGDATQTDVMWTIRGTFYSQRAIATGATQDARYLLTQVLKARLKGLPEYAIAAAEMKRLGLEPMSTSELNAYLFKSH